LLADDNPALLQTVFAVLHAYEIAGAVGNGKAVLERVGALRPDLIVLDISLGDMNGFEGEIRGHDWTCYLSPAPLFVVVFPMARSGGER
jgi:two-component system, NarL family, response regulator NreC